MRKFNKIIFILSFAIFYGKAFSQVDPLKDKIVSFNLCYAKKIKILESKEQLDTLNYLEQNFEVNKLNYIGQPFSVLLNSMTLIQPKTVWWYSPPSNKDFRTASFFKFTYKELSFDNAVTLYIEWETPLPSSETKALSAANQFYFTNDEKMYYGTKIIKDIKVYR